MNNRVVITGIGPITSTGKGKEEFFENLLSQKNNICEIPKEYKDMYNFKSRYYIPAPEVDLEEYNLPKSLEKAMGDAAKIAVASARLAIEDAGLNVESGDKYFKVNQLEYADIVIGLGLNSIQMAYNSNIAHVFAKDKDILERYNLDTRYNRMLVPISMPNAISSWISVLYNIKGTNFTVNASCASGTYAIGEAYMRIKNGISKSVLTGGVECLKEKHGSIMRGFDMLKTLTRSENGLPMPFSQKRSGFLFNEGAGCIVILEELNSAIERGAHIYAEICDYKSSSDAHNIVQMDESGRGIIKLLKDVIQNEKIDYFNPHGTATEQNDRIEANAIKEVFGGVKDQPLIGATKGVIGHSLGASGALEAAVTALSIDKSIVHGFKTKEPIDGLNLLHKTVSTKIKKALSASYGFGGHNGVLLLKRFE
ncbi:beta-ketoacyl-[acyl-carrier-protein] synthase family protein [Herbivorax sp. ANBcel31]|uniref:beta-ketoacyl-[acyl-carrier-protein] synthase family protein n=1 Tax=Herbivorax sp. ANBcel31 TaxID=3069754 RepID=UPI0027B421F0|nr:beta-ketoacyl-[acyl-carrier-protein] synthase family protein [Herbivorax sp. ANBcel31]MDQ2087528.1 beta-ketoacyl-[acyl-carrier-protein] synthase family protein [Herbivorax sp. ANBcel31]